MLCMTIFLNPTAHNGFVLLTSQSPIPNTTPPTHSPRLPTQSYRTQIQLTETYITAGASTIQNHPDNGVSTDHTGIDG